MCGIFGAFLKTSFTSDDLKLAQQSRDALTHRGPDQHNEYSHENFYLGHRRLSIIDLSPCGIQPMISEDENVVIAVNGEIYNFQEIRSELISHGYQFKSKSDSEVVLHGFRLWGLSKLVKKLDGMFAGVIYDKKNQQIHLFRDIVGIKPMYYFYDGVNFSWASELKALKVWNHQKLSINNEALIDFLTYRYIPAPKSIYQNIFKLPAASFLTFSMKTQKLEIEQYWKLTIKEQIFKNDLEIKEKLNHLIAKSVKEQMISDVPLGFLLSGGIDSSVITGVGAKLVQRPLTFSIDFIQKSEAKFAKQIADYFKTEHHSRLFKQEQMEDLQEKMAQWFDEPFGDTSALPTFEVSAFAREFVTVALSGDGGDELFGGYKWYDKFEKILKIRKFIFPFMKFFPLHQLSKNKNLELVCQENVLEVYAQIRGALSPEKMKMWKEQLGVDPNYDHLWAYRKYYQPTLSPKKLGQWLDFHTYLPDDILTKVDRVSMNVSLECRPPFLSKDLIEFAFSLPEKFLYRDGELKGGLKFAVAELLPPNIIQRKKQGFSVPDLGWRKKYQTESMTEVMVKNFMSGSQA
jgi:asparagine synthase (glutamine-hydrolysing)